MTAPEPVEVPADELAAAEARLRDVFGGKTDFSPLGWYDLGLLLAEYDRMHAELFAYRTIDAQCDAASDAYEQQIRALRAELAELRKNSIPLNYAPAPEQEIRVEFDDE